MNILIFSWRGPGHPNEGGAEQSTHEHAKAWVDAGHEVTLFTSYYEGAKKEETVDKVRIIRKGSQILGVQLAALFWYIFENKTKYNVVIDQFHGIPFFTPLFVKARIFGFIHEVAGEVWTFNPLPFPISLFPAIIGPKIEPIIFRFLYRNIPFITVSESTKDDLISTGIRKENITIIKNGVTPHGLKVFPKKEDRYTAMYLGAISQDKGTKDALRAFAEVNRRDKNWQYWIVGKGTPEILNDLKTLTKDLKLNKIVKFWGFVDDTKKFELLARSHVLVNPSFKEGWGLVNIEANSVGTPVVGYKVHGTKDSVVIGKTGMLVDRGDYKKMAKSILDLVKDKRRYKNIQISSKKWAQSFSWEKSTNKSLLLIEKYS